MTGQREREYITTLENICNGCDLCNRDETDGKCSILHNVRSRPAPQQSDALAEILKEYDNFLWIELQGCGISRGVADAIFLNAHHKLHYQQEAINDE